MGGFEYNSFICLNLHRKQRTINEVTYTMNYLLSYVVVVQSASSAPSSQLGRIDYRDCITSSYVRCTPNSEHIKQAFNIIVHEHQKIGEIYRRNYDKDF